MDILLSQLAEPHALYRKVIVTAFRGLSSLFSATAMQSLIEVCLVGEDLLVLVYFVNHEKDMKPVCFAPSV